MKACDLLNNREGVNVGKIGYILYDACIHQNTWCILQESPLFLPFPSGRYCTRDASPTWCSRNFPVSLQPAVLIVLTAIHWSSWTEQKARIFLKKSCSLASVSRKGIDLFHDRSILCARWKGSPGPKLAEKIRSIPFYDLEDPLVLYPDAFLLLAVNKVTAFAVISMDHPGCCDSVLVHLFGQLLFFLPPFS